MSSPTGAGLSFCDLDTDTRMEIRRHVDRWNGDVMGYYGNHLAVYMPADPTHAAMLHNGLLERGLMEVPNARPYFPVVGAVPDHLRHTAGYHGPPSFTKTRRYVPGIKLELATLDSPIPYQLPFRGIEPSSVTIDELHIFDDERPLCGCKYCHCPNTTTAGEVCNDCLNGIHQG